MRARTGDGSERTAQVLRALRGTYRRKDSKTYSFGTHALKRYQIVILGDSMNASHSFEARRADSSLSKGAVLIGTALIGWVQCVQAQEAAPASGAALEEVIVTAERRQQNLQAVPLSVTALGDEAIVAMRIQEASDIGRYTPGVNIGTSAQARSSTTRIRGIGGAGDGWPGTDSPVGIFVDGVYYGRSADLTVDLFDLERIEVLRGPQGTLYGKNVSAGAINIISRKPSETLEGRVEATAGSYDRREFRGYISGPLSESISAKLSYSNSQRDGYTKNVFTGQEMDDLNRSSVRGQVRWEGEDSEVLFTADYSDIDETSKPTFLFGDSIAGYTPPTAPDRASLNTDSYFRQSPWSVSLTAEHDFSFASLTSISAYRESRYNQHGDGDGTSLTLNGAGLISYYNNKFDQFTQEVRLSSNTDGRLSWVAGAFYFRSNESMYITHSLGALPGSTVSVLNLANGFGVGPHMTINEQGNQGTSYAAFSQATYNIFSTVNVTAGLRWTRDEKDGFNATSGQRNVSLFIWPTPFRADVARSWDAVTPKFTIDYTPVEDIFLYATAAKGFKSGGFVGQAVEPVAAATLFNPEYVWNYELGVKSELFDRMRLNLAVFQMDYTDLQITDIIGTRRLTVNAGEARIRGAELDAEFALTDALNLHAKYSYTDTEYTSFPATAASGDLTGKQFVAVPEQEGLIGASYITPIGSGELQVRADVAHTGERFLNLRNTVSDGSITRLDMRVSYDLGPYTFALWGKNLTDDRGVASQFTDISLFIQPLGSGRVSGYTNYTPPREYGATVGYRF